MKKVKVLQSVNPFISKVSYTYCTAHYYYHWSSLIGTKTRTKSKSIKRHSSILDGADIAKLPPGDSDEEAELVMLTTAKMSSSMSESSPVGREHPFSPMVNREMLYCLVRQAFQQTEEQRINFEASLKHEYGRRSKGEVRSLRIMIQSQHLSLM